jgi:hypothetical protein
MERLLRHIGQGRIRQLKSVAIAHIPEERESPFSRALMEG